MTSNFHGDQIDENQLYFKDHRRYDGLKKGQKTHQDTVDKHDRMEDRHKKKASDHLKAASTPGTKPAEASEHRQAFASHSKATHFHQNVQSALKRQDGKGDHNWLRYYFRQKNPTRVAYNKSAETNFRSPKKLEKPEQTGPKKPEGPSTIPSTSSKSRS